MTKPVTHMRRPNVRRLRAQALASEVMHVLHLHLRYADVEIDDRRCYDALLEFFERKGVQIITDQDRKQLHLPEAGPDGWTAEEIVALEKARLDALSRPIQILLPTEIANRPASEKAEG